jgi:AraC-like DNA-binding protein
VATALLCCFPSTFTDHALPDETSTRLPGPVRRAVTYIDEHLGEPIDLTHLAAAARIPAHQLVIAFRQHLGTTPGGYLRTARLDAAHHGLLEADPSRGDTVGAIAYRYGFTDLARFATEYRIQYGCTPTETFRS